MPDTSRESRFNFGMLDPRAAPPASELNYGIPTAARGGAELLGLGGESVVGARGVAGGGAAQARTGNVTGMLGGSGGVINGRPMGRLENVGMSYAASPFANVGFDYSARPAPPPMAYGAQNTQSLLEATQTLPRQPPMDQRFTLRYGVRF
jgi:hypothetical protein